MINFFYGIVVTGFLSMVIMLGLAFAIIPVLIKNEERKYYKLIEEKEYLEENQLYTD